MKYFPLIKWTGTKRSSTEEILKYFPYEIDSYYEPFCGSCSLGISLLQNEKINVKRFVFSDINKDLINLLNAIKSTPNTIIESYFNLWNEFNNEICQEGKKKFLRLNSSGE
jgi:DNA adenine methylase